MDNQQRIDELVEKVVEMAQHMLDGECCDDEL